MKLSHYLRCAPSGVWHFRQRIPHDLVPLFGCVEKTRSLRTRDVRQAQLYALHSAEAYARTFERVRGLARGRRMTGKDLPSLIELATNGEQYKIKRHADGSLELEARGEEDHRLMKDALERIGQIDQAQMARDLSHARARLAATSAATPAASTPAPAADPYLKIPVIAIGKAGVNPLPGPKPELKAIVEHIRNCCSTRAHAGWP